MSDALSYLLAVRGDALGHYFKFLKDAGKHLDPKTRNLISVISKVHSQTEGGLKQYLMRALREGATPLEVIDALMMAFPTLGLAKIVWATEIILEMDIPEFRPDMINGQPSWHDVGATMDFKDQETARVACDGRELFVNRQGRGIQSVRQPLSASGHQHPASSTGGQAINLSQTSVEIRYHHRAVHRKRQSTAEIIRRQSGEWPLIRPVVSAQ